MDNHEIIWRLFNLIKKICSLLKHFRKKSHLLIVEIIFELRLILFWNQKRSSAYSQVFNEMCSVVEITINLLIDCLWPSLIISSGNKWIYCNFLGI